MSKVIKSITANLLSSCFCFVDTILTGDNKISRRLFWTKPGVVDARVDAAIVHCDVFDAKGELTGNRRVHRVASNKVVCKRTSAVYTCRLSAENPVDRYRSLSTRYDGVRATVEVDVLVEVSRSIMWSSCQ